MLFKGSSPRSRPRPLALAGRARRVPRAVSPGQRVDLKVLLLSADGTEPGFGAWKAALDREGVPYDTRRRRHAAPRR